MEELVIQSLDKIDEAAEEFISLMGDSKVFAFYGEMGAGKTTFIKSLCKLLEVRDVVSSPTFALVYEYHSLKKGSVYHFDLYRIEELSELYDLGYEDYFYSGNLCFIEWPEKAESLLPEFTKKVKIQINDDSSRSILI